MTLQRNTTDAPHLGRTVLIAPNRRINLAGAGHPLATIKPRTRLGAVALDLTMQTSIATIQIIATTAYVNMLTALAAPAITFTKPPPGEKGTPVQQLQEAYQSFVQGLAILQGQAMSWIATSSSTGTPSIFSTLVAIPDNLALIEATVEKNFTLLKTLPAGSDWDKVLKAQKTLINVQIEPVTALGGQIEALGNSLEKAARNLVAAAGTDVLAQLQKAYKDEISAMNAAIADAESTISSDNSKIVGLGFAAGISIVVAVIGLINIATPFGWLFLGGGAVGAYFAIDEIQSLNADVAAQKLKIQSATATASADQTAAQAVAAFAQAAQAAATLNSAAQKELTTLVNLCATLASDLEAAVQDLSQEKVDQKDIDEAMAEWSEIIQASQFLAGITAYTWPSAIQLANPTSLAAAGNNAWLVSNSGIVYRYSTGGNSWTALPDYSLSVAVAGDTLYAIDGAPADGTNKQPSPYGRSFNVKSLQGSASAWQTISDFKAAQITTDGSSIWAVKQDVGDRQAYKFAGGTSWTPVGAMPNGEVPGDIAAYDGTLFAIANNDSSLWYAGSSGWKQIGSVAYSRLSANGPFLGLLDPNGYTYVISLATPGSYTRVPTGSYVTVLAQAPNGDQYVIDTKLNLWHIVYTPGGAPPSTLVRRNIVGVAVSDGGKVYATDNSGEVWTLPEAGGNWQLLPALPTS